MNLYNKLKKYSIKDAIYFEENDRQFLALQKLYKNKKFSDELYLFLIIANSLICYQLSWKWEDYWEEFSTSPLIPLLIGEGNIDFWNIYKFFEKFLKSSKNNKRFIETKLKRIKKITSTLATLTSPLVSKEATSPLAPLLRGEGDKIWIEKFEFYYKNMDKLAEKLAKIMNQKKDAKTIVFAVKMFSYWARNVFSYLEKFPKNLMIPIDSRLENLYKLETWKIDFNKKEIKEFYIDLSKKLDIPLLHLDAILWVNYDELIKE